jgi:molybdopterin molybdotransferase
MQIMTERKKVQYSINVDCPFKEIQQCIMASLPEISGEEIRLEDALHRIIYSDISAPVCQPLFDESTRDGYVVAGGGENCFRIVGEIPAGSPYDKPLETGTCCRIMTGGNVPDGGVRIVPDEDCTEKDGNIYIKDHYTKLYPTFIKKKGSEVAAGTRLLVAGTRLGARQLPFLSSCGVEEIEVAKLPSVGFFCTGSELQKTADSLEKGQKISSNSLLLKGLLTVLGVPAHDFGIVRDDPHELRKCLYEIVGGKLDVIISTGGMGPGKYDLVEQVFQEVGGKVIFSKMAMRPGKSVLFGILGRALYFGLPGPPNAVQTLFDLLVTPAILGLQGEINPWPKRIKVFLDHGIRQKRNDVLCFREGVLRVENGKCYVRFAERNEYSNCFILLQTGVPLYKKGQLVEVISANTL